MAEINVNWQDKTDLVDDVNSEIFNNAFKSIKESFDSVAKDLTAKQNYMSNMAEQIGFNTDDISFLGEQSEKHEEEIGKHDQRIEDLEKISDKVASVIKETATGEIVRIDDVSPIAHTSTVKLTSDTVTDFSGVTLSKYGKNLWDFGADKRFTKQADGSFVNKQNIQNNRIPVNLPVGDYVVYYVLASQPSGANYRMVFVHGDGTTTGNWGGRVTIKGKSIVSYYFDYGSVATPGNLVITVPQIESGTTRTNYEEYKEKETYTPNADGTAEGIELNAPTTTLLTDTEGVNINVEYNADTKSYIDKKFAELQALILEG